ncbi:AAA family ATPase [[Pseudopropionibacterium] massiliense]|uniref:AAA family ATPase n=1 Tax=[Pseudopropionibacterium] massiliense TaxID=2220000 RepID=UPI00102F5587|nr:ATP-binding protein [[Pseudopropionibacterium] massiliense]
MLLLSFSARNHRSLRDETVLDLTRPSFRTLRPRGGGTWQDQTYPVAAILGANASGKSAIVDALWYARSAIMASASGWLSQKKMPRDAFALDDSSMSASSEFAFDFVLDGVRHQYRFEIDDEGVVGESLFDLPGARRRRLLLRDSTGMVKLHPDLGPIGPVAKRELVLSRALQLGRGGLEKIAGGLLGGVMVLPLGEDHRRSTAKNLAEILLSPEGAGESSREYVVSLLQMADIGIVDAGPDEEVLPPELLEVQRHLNLAQKKLFDVGGPGRGEGEEKLLGFLDDVVRNLWFEHQGTRSRPGKLSLERESAGTVAWLALVIPAVVTLQQGGVLVVDEIDSSLHPHLVEMLIGFFADEQKNPLGSQLICTTHDSYLISPQSSVKLEPEQIWLTEKGNDGASELYSLADFPRHKGANVAKRYLSGRYGGVPSLAPSFLGRVLDLDGEPSAVQDAG